MNKRRRALRLKAEQRIDPGARVVVAVDRFDRVAVAAVGLCSIDIPNLASNSNETLVWERNADVVPPAGTKVTLVIEPARAKQAPSETATTAPSGPRVGASFRKGTAMRLASWTSFRRSWLWPC